MSMYYVDSQERKREVNPITIREFEDAAYNLEILAKSGSNWTWTQLAEFLHYVNTDKDTIERIKQIVYWLRANGNINYKERKKGITNLVFLKKEVLKED